MQPVQGLCYQIADVNHLKSPTNCTEITFRDKFATESDQIYTNYLVISRTSDGLYLQSVNINHVRLSTIGPYSTCVQHCIFSGYFAFPLHRLNPPLLAIVKELNSYRIIHYLLHHKFPLHPCYCSSCNCY